ncbi:MAG: ABC transporter permease subunit [Clostridia bacterium]|nr:ABC transporter permease subunit [Clostridia bacterium]
MSSLIKNEVTKIFKKKGIYITLLVILAFVILTNCVYKYFYNNISYSYYGDGYIDYAKQEIAKLDPSKPSDTKMYIDLKTQLDIYDMMKEYQQEDWQREIIGSHVATYINERNTYLYGADKEEQKVKEIEKTIDEINQKLKNDDWKYFASEELKRAEEKVKNLEEEQKQTQDKQELENIKTSLVSAKIDLEVAKYRVDKEIKYGNDYRNNALNVYQNESKNVEQLKASEQQLTYKQKQEYHTSIEEKEINQYIIENNVDIKKSNDVRGILKNFFSEYGLFIIVMVIMIAGTLVSEEFNKGTIKLLLVKPYSREKILLAKFITMFIIIAFSLVAVVGMELIVGGIIFGWDSLSIPVLEYNFHTNTLESINIFTYLGISIAAKLPIIILLATLAFAFSTLFTNSAVAIALPLLGFMGADMINQLVLHYNVTFMKFFVTPNWDFSQYLFGDLPLMEGMTALFSGIVCLVYFFIMVVTTFIVFKKKNIKNI